MHWPNRKSLKSMAKPPLKDISDVFLIEIADVLKSANSLFEAEKCYLEALCTPELCVKSRVLCLKGLASICNQQKDWVKARQYCEEALELLELLNVPSFDDPETRLKHHVFFLVQLGDALEGQGEWTSARQSDEQALTFWESQPRRGVYMSVLRRDGLVLIREGKLWTLGNGCSRRFTSTKCSWT